MSSVKISLQINLNYDSWSTRITRTINNNNNKRQSWCAATLLWIARNIVLYYLGVIYNITYTYLYIFIELISSMFGREEHFTRPPSASRVIDIITFVYQRTNVIHKQFQILFDFHFSFDEK